jgi:predicted acyl esterase
MIKSFFRLTLLLTLLVTACKDQDAVKAETATAEKTYVKDNYDKQEVTIEMRDGIKLHTTI